MLIIQRIFMILIILICGLFLLSQPKSTAQNTYEITPMVMPVAWLEPVDPAIEYWMKDFKKSNKK
jgi:hypothetical protein